MFLLPMDCGRRTVRPRSPKLICRWPIPVHTQIKQAELEKKVQEVRRLTLLNNLAEEKSILVEDVKSRIGSAGALLRTGADGARRSIEVVCCDGCRDAVVTEFDAAIGATVEAVARALEGR